MRLLVIMPTMNEHDSLVRLILELMALTLNISLLIVDNHSQDGTAKLINDLQTQYPQSIHLLCQPQDKPGLGGAYKAGFKWASNFDCDFVVQMDADGSHAIEHIEPLISSLQAQQADVVIGSRYVKDAQIKNWPIKRHLTSRASCWFAQRVLGIPIKDITGGFKVFKHEVIRKFSKYPLRTRHFAFQIEVNALCYYQGLHCIERPITFIDRSRGQSKLKLQMFAEGFFTVLRLRLTQTKPINSAQEEYNG